jgi:hypothetical protein
MSGLCMVTENPFLSATVTVLGLLLVFSWIVGLISLWLVSLRPIYWALLLLIPLGFAVQTELLHRQILSCDGP